MALTTNLIQIRIDGGPWYSLKPRQRELRRVFMWWWDARADWRTRWDAVLELETDEVKARMADLRKLLGAMLWDKKPGALARGRPLSRLKAGVEMRRSDGEKANG